jgi:hypothetical protein
MNEGGDPRLARNLEFTVPTAETLARMYIKNPPYVDKNCDEVRATPTKNIVATKELLEHNKSPSALETAVKLMTKALVQQEKATSSQWLKSDPVLCRSSTASKAWGNGNYGTRPDNESHTGSLEVRRREARNRADAIPISSDDKPHGKGHQRNPSPPHKNYPAYGYQDKANLAISPTCRHQSTRCLKSHREELSYAIMMASEEGVVTLAGETSRHSVKPVGMAGPGIWNHLAMTTVRIAMATRISIALHAVAMTKGRAPTAMTMTQLHEEQREAVADAEIHRRTSRVKGVTLHHPHQEAPMAAAVAAQPGHAPPERSAGQEAKRRVNPPKRDCQVLNSLLSQPEVLWTTDS